MQDTFARATRAAGRPSAARDDRVSCIELLYDYLLLNQTGGGHWARATKRKVAAAAQATVNFIGGHEPPGYGPGCNPSLLDNVLTNSLVNIKIAGENNNFIRISYTYVPY